MTTRPAAELTLHVGDILRRPGTRRELSRRVRLPALELSVSRVQDGAEVALDAVVESLSEGVMVTGAAEVPWVATCRRCLQEARGTLRAEFRELFERRPVEGETYRLDGDHIDLEPLVREVVLLDLPLAPLCADDCPGLCPTCGADRREGCACSVDVRDDRWAALDQLRFD